MAWNDLYNNLDVVDMLTITNLSADGYSRMVDLDGYNSALFVIIAGTQHQAAAAGHKFVWILQESATTANAGFAAVATADVLGASREFDLDSAAKVGKSHKLGYKGNKRYVRWFADETGTVTVHKCAALAILGNLRHAPATTSTIVGKATTA